MGGLWKKMPITALTCLIGSLALAGMFPFNGFFSKDAILSAAFEHDKVLFGIGVVAAFFSAFYAGRWFLIIFGPTEKKHLHVHESPLSMTLPLIIMSFGALLSGILNYMFENPFGSWILTSLPYTMEEYVHESLAVHESLLSFVPLFSMVLSTATLLLTFTIYFTKTIPRSTFEKTFPTNVLQRWLNKGYGIDRFYYAFAGFMGYRFTRALDWIDVHIVDGSVNLLGRLGIFLAFKVIDNIDIHVVDGTVNGIADISFGFGEKLRRFQTGIVGSYATAIIVGIVLLMIAIKFLGG